MRQFVKEFKSMYISSTPIEIQINDFLNEHRNCSIRQILNIDSKGNVFLVVFDVTDE